MGRKSWVGLLAVVACSGIVGCGSDDDEAAVTSAAATTQAPADTAAATTAAAPETTAAPATTEAPETTAAAAEPAVIPVQVDGHVDDFRGAFLAYFPDKVKAHPGDTIEYKSNFTGEPHSVAFGRDITALIEGFRALTPEQLASDEPPPPELLALFEKIPPMLPDGPGDALQTSVNPCFVETGEIPTDTTQQCPVTEPTPFTGTETFYNSGFLPDQQVFELQLADDIKPGQYLAFCTLHFVEMVSEVTVVPADEAIPTADEVADEAQSQLEALAAKVAPAVEAAKAAPEPGHVQAGVGSEEVTNALGIEFVPAEIEVPAGEPITWTINGPHSVGFNLAEDARVILASAGDGGFHAVERAAIPIGFEAPPPPAEETDEPPPPVDAGVWDGTGEFSSGVMFAGDFILRISTPGTYPYICTVHPEMKGSVTVT